MNYATVLAQMEADLRRCRRQITTAVFTGRMRNAAHTFAVMLVGIGGVSLVLKLTTGHVPELSHALIAAALAAVLVFGRVIWRRIADKPVDVGSAAERLDLSHSTHNRIATAVDLLRSGDDSEFARAAIRDGQECLARFKMEGPFLDRVLTPWRRIAGLLVVGVALFVAVAFVGYRAGRVGAVAGSSDGTGATVARLQGSSTAHHVGPRKPKVIPEKEQSGATDGREGRAAAGTDHKSTLLSDDNPSAGSASQQAASNARRSQTASNSRNTGGATSGAGSKAKPSSKGKPQRKRLGSSKPAVKEPAVKKSQKGGSMNARGSSGGGAMKTSESDFSSKVEARSGDQEDSVDEDEPDDDPDGEKQRLGMQPGLKNRTSKISRELSLSMGKGDDNSTSKGRGGPSAQKKSRGTTTMILGVPIPGFVRGRLLPGSTKSTQEEAEPSSRRSTYATAVTLEQAVPQEEYQERYRPSVDDGAQASKYLIDLHNEAENKTNKIKESDTNE